MRISVFCLGLNLVLAVLLVWHFKQGGLGIANTASAALNIFLLSHALGKKLSKLEMQSVRRAIAPLLIATALAGLLSWWGWRVWESALGHGNLGLKIGAVFVPAIAAAIIYWLVTLVMKVPVAKEMLEFVQQKPALK